MVGAVLQDESHPRDLVTAQWSLLAGVSEALRRERKRRTQVEPRTGQVVALSGAGQTNLFNGWYELLGDVGSNGVVFKLQLGVVLWLKRLKDTCDFTVLAGSSRLLLVSVVKPAGRRFISLDVVFFFNQK